MKHSLQRFSLVLVFISACGLGERDTQGSDAESPADLGAAEGDESKEDPWSCGEIGAVCIGPLGIGECINGQCGATLGECHRPPGDCNSICALDDRPCVELACEGATAFGWNTPTQAEADTLCVVGHEQSATPLLVACDEPLDDLAMIVSCCCSW